MRGKSGFGKWVLLVLLLVILTAVVFPDLLVKVKAPPSVVAAFRKIHNLPFGGGERTPPAEVAQLVEPAPAEEPRERVSIGIRVQRWAHEVSIALGGVKEVGVSTEDTVSGAPKFCCGSALLAVVGFLLLSKKGRRTLKGWIQGAWDRFWGLVGTVTRSGTTGLTEWALNDPGMAVSVSGVVLCIVLPFVGTVLIRTFSEGWSGFVPSLLTAGVEAGIPLVVGAFFFFVWSAIGDAPQSGGTAAGGLVDGLLLKSGDLVFAFILPVLKLADILLTMLVLGGILLVPAYGGPQQLQAQLLTAGSPTWWTMAVKIMSLAATLPISIASSVAAIGVVLFIAGWGVKKGLAGRGGRAAGGFGFP